MSLRIGIVGTGAISHLHARAYRNIGYVVTACTDINADAGHRFAAEHKAAFVPNLADLCSRDDVDVVDVCTLPNVRLEPLELAAAHGKAVQVQKPIATTVETAERMLDIARRAGIVLGVVSQHRFDESSQFLHRAIHAGRLGRLLQVDAYVKWYRSTEYYSRPVKGSWAGEGGGALMNQAIHQVDLLDWLAGPVAEVSAMWQLGGLHRIESEDIVNALLRYSSGATGVIQAATAFWPGSSERIEFHGTKGSAVVTGDRLTSWDVQNDDGDPPPLSSQVASGASDPMAISLEPFERQFLDFGHAVRTKGRPLVSGADGLAAIRLVDAVYRSCRTGERVMRRPRHRRCGMSVRLSLAAITDEYSQDLPTALAAMAEVGMTGVELRTVDGRNIVDLTNDELDRARDLVQASGMRVLSIASPVLKCTLPDGPALDPRFQQDTFGSQRTFADQPALIERTFEVAARAGAGIVRVFSYWRTVEPASVSVRW